MRVSNGHLIFVLNENALFVLLAATLKVFENTETNTRKSTMQCHRSPTSSHLQLPPSFFIKAVFIAICIVESIRTDHVWEDFPGGEMKDILTDIGISKDTEKINLESKVSKDPEELSYDIFPPSPISEAQRQYLPNYPERELEDEYIVDPRMLVAIIINCLILDLAFLAMLFHFLCKICPIIRQKIYSFQACEKKKKLECETSTSTPSTVKKDVISVDNVVFETD